MMPALNFSKIEFANYILTGRKPFTIRKDTERNQRLFVPGALINFYFNQRAAIKSKPVDIDGNPVHGFLKGIKCLGSFPIEINQRKVYISQWDDTGVELDGFEPLWEVLRKNGLSTHMVCTFDLFEVLAYLDGFESWQEMKLFFNLDNIEMYRGRLILWEPIKREPILQWCYACGRKRPIHLMQQCGDLWECKDKSCGGSK